MPSYAEIETDRVRRMAPDMVALLADPSWAQRAVERIEFLDESRVRRQVTIEFNVPPGVSGIQVGRDVYLPVQVLTKERITALEVTDGEGRIVPTLTSDLNGELSGEILIEQARGALGRAPREDVVSVLRQVANQRTPSGPVLEKLLSALDDVALAEWDQLDESPDVWLEPLWNGFLLVARVTGAPGDALLVRREYEEEVKISGGHGAFQASALWRVGSYHIEFLAPEGTVIADSFLGVTTARDIDGRARRYQIELDRDQRVDHADLYAQAGKVEPELSELPPEATTAEFWLRARPATIEPVLLVSIFVNATFLAGGLAAQANWLTDIPNAATVVVALPALAAGYLASTGHRLTQRLLRGVQWAAFWVAAASFDAAFALVVTPSHEHLRSPETGWIPAAAVALAVLTWPVLVRQILAARFNVSGTGPVPNAARRALASARWWLLVPLGLVVLSLLTRDSTVLGGIPTTSRSPRGWLWIAGGAVSGATTFYLMLAWLRAQWNTGQVRRRTRS